MVFLQWQLLNTKKVKILIQKTILSISRDSMILYGNNLLTLTIGTYRGMQYFSLKTLKIEVLSVGEKRSYEKE